MAELSSHSISVKATDGSTKVVEFDGQTKFLKGESAAAASDVHVGDRVVIHAHKMDTMLHAAEVIGAAKPPPRSRRLNEYTPPPYSPCCSPASPPTRRSSDQSTA